MDIEGVTVCVCVYIMFKHTVDLKSRMGGVISHPRSDY